MIITNISFNDKLKLYAIQRALKDFYTTGYCGGINDVAGHHLYDWLNDQKPIEIPVETKKELWGVSKKQFSTNFKDRQQDTYILHEIYKTNLVQYELERLKKERITVELKFEL